MSDKELRKLLNKAWDEGFSEGEFCPRVYPGFSKVPRHPRYRDVTKIIKGWKGKKKNG